MTVKPEREELLALVDKIRGGVRNGWGYAREECADFIAVLTAKPAEAGWQDISTAPKDGQVFDVWLGGPDIDEEDIKFYCGVDTRRSASWHYLDGKFRPCAGLSSIPTFVYPTHWRPLPAPPSTTGEPKR